MYLTLLTTVFLAALAHARHCTTLAYNNNRPSSAICGSLGKLGSPAVLKKFPHDHSNYGIPCILACLNEGSRCKALSASQMNSTSQVTGCTLYSETLTDMALNATADDPEVTYFDDIKCFECIECNLETEKPKITNGGFGDSKTAIAPWTFETLYSYNKTACNYALVPGHLQVGDGNALRVTAAADNSLTYIIVRQTIPTCAKINTIYKFSFNYRFGSLGENQYDNYFSFHFPNVYEYVYPRDTAWHNYEIRGYWDPGVSDVSFNYTSYINQTFYLDNVRLEPMKTGHQGQLEGHAVDIALG